MDYKPTSEYRRSRRNKADKRTADFETRMRVTMECKARMHAVKLTGRPIKDALKGKTAHYAAAFTGKPISIADWERMKKESTAKITLIDA